jgi:hypothetical protein
VVLGLFWVLLTASLRDKSLTFDEASYATAGYADWRFHDFRLAPESGQLPQRLIGVPLALGSYRFPATDSPLWRDSRFLELGSAWFYEIGNDAAAMAARGRGAAGLLAVALGALVWAWSRRLFGPVGGMVSLFLYVLSPTVLANGALIGSDMAVALFFAAALGALWRLMQRLTLGRLTLSALLIGGLILSKLSALLIVPMAALLVAVRLVDGRPLPVMFGRSRELTHRDQQALALGGAALFHVLVVVAMIWAAYDFRYSAFNGTADQQGRFALPWEYFLAKSSPAELLQQVGLTPEQDTRAERIFQQRGLSPSLWINPAVDALAEVTHSVLTPAQQARLDELRAEPPPTLAGRAVEFARRHELMPEAWIYGLADILWSSQWRGAFFNGEFSVTGWPAFFPYTFAVKTPLAVFGVLALAVAAAVAGWRRGNAASPPASQGHSLWPGFYRTLPLWTLLLVYGEVIVASHLNIGHRHMLPLYAPMFVLAGIAGRWIEAWPRAGRMGRFAGALLLGLLGLLAVEVLARFPNYLAYFNGVVSPAQAYRHLVDSSLDWGQDLPAAQHYLDAHPERGPYYLSYFGIADPNYYGIQARPLFSYFGLQWHRHPPMAILPVPLDQPETAVAAQRQTRPDYDMLVVMRFPHQAYSVWLKKPAELRLAGGTYLISASMLQPVYYDLKGPWGPWNSRHEAVYQQLLADIKPLMGDDPAARRAALNRHSPWEWSALLQRFDGYQLARLTAWLRKREADETLNYSILVYHLTDADVSLALEGPPPELGADRAQAVLEQIAAGQK